MWGGSLELDEFLAWRKTSPQHNRARWYVGILDGEVVTSLGCYPLVFSIDGDNSPGIGFGAVHTRPDHREKGFAPQLLDYVEETETEMGACYSLLYSDIKPDYYGRRGYQICPNWQAYQNATAFVEQHPETEFQSASVDKSADIDAVADIYDAYHCQEGFAVRRDAEYWQYLLKKRPKDDLFWMCSPAGERVGYGRLESAGDEVRVTDFGMADSNADLAPLWRLAGQRAKAINPEAQFGGWLPDDASLKTVFDFEPKPAEISMIKPLGNNQINSSALASCHRLCEVDHF